MFPLLCVKADLEQPKITHGRLLELQCACVESAAWLLDVVHSMCTFYTSVLRVSMVALPRDALGLHPAATLESRHAEAEWKGTCKKCDSEVAALSQASTERN